MAALGDVFAAPPEAFIYEVASTLTLEEVLAAALHQTTAYDRNQPAGDRHPLDPS